MVAEGGGQGGSARGARHSFRLQKVEILIQEGTLQPKVRARTSRLKVLHRSRKSPVVRYREPQAGYSCVSETGKQLAVVSG